MTKPVDRVQDKLEFLSFSYIIPAPTEGSIGAQRVLGWESQFLKDLFERQTGFIKVVTTSNPPSRGVHVTVYQTNGSSISAWCKASIWTVGILPCYADGIVSKVYFDLYSDNVPKQSYSYDISRTGVSWIGLLPFIWINIFTAQYKEAFSANAYQFIADAKRDGFF